MSRTLSDISAEKVRRLLDYDPTTGVFRWRVSRGQLKAGSIAGAFDSFGHRQIRINRRKYLAHRLAWLYVTGAWPDGDLDHEDLDPANNRFANLRLATPAQNQHNRALQKNNTSGFKGVSFRRRTGNWSAYIGINWKKQHLGCFSSPEAAHEAYVKASRKLHGNYGRVE